MQLRKLGNSDLMVSPIGLGCWQFSKRKGLSGKYWGLLEDSEIVKIVRASLNGGVNWFDTAEVYGWGESEKALSRALDQTGKKRNETIIATKWWPVFRTARSIKSTIDKRLSALNTDCIDLYQIHNPFSFSSIRAEARAMVDLIKAHQVRYVGVSNFSARQMRKFQNELSHFGYNLVSNQVNYSLLNRKIETNGILEAAEDLGISIIAHSPLASGLLTGKFHENPELIQNKMGFRKFSKSFKREGLRKSWPLIDALMNLAEKYQVTPSQVALNWLISFHGDLVVAIPGATTVDQAKDNANSMMFELSKDEIYYLDKVSTLFKT